jgi:hypothetical protein
MATTRRGRDRLVEPTFPKFGYYLDETDPDILILRRQDGTFVAAFSTRGATKECIIRANKEDYLALIRVQTGSLGLREGEESA